MNNDARDPSHSTQQNSYAILMSCFSKTSFLFLVLSFICYFLGILPSHISLEKLPFYWNLPLNTFVEQTNSPTGWNWLARIGQGDFASLMGIAFLAGCSIPCLMAMIPSYFRQHDRIYLLLCLMQITVLMLAASGWLAG